MIQHPKDAARAESGVPGANGSVPSPQSTQGAPGQGVRAASPPCLIQRQVQTRWILNLDSSPAALWCSSAEVNWSHPNQSKSQTLEFTDPPLVDESGIIQFHKSVHKNEPILQSRLLLFPADWNVNTFSTQSINICEASPAYEMIRSISLQFCLHTVDRPGQYGVQLHRGRHRGLRREQRQRHQSDDGRRNVGRRHPQQRPRGALQAALGQTDGHMQAGEDRTPGGHKG